MTNETEEAGTAVVREMAAYVQRIYGREPTEDELERFWDAFSEEADRIYNHE